MYLLTEFKSGPGRKKKGLIGHGERTEYFPARVDLKSVNKHFIIWNISENNGAMLFKLTKVTF